MNTFSERLQSDERPPFADPSEYFDHLSASLRGNEGLRKQSALLYAASVAVNMEVPVDEKMRQVERVITELDTDEPTNHAIAMACRLGTMLIEPQIGRLELYTHGTVVTDQDGINAQRATALGFLGLVVRGEKPHLPGELPWQWQYPTWVNDVVVLQTEHMQSGHLAYKPTELAEITARGEKAPDKLFTRIIAARPGYVTGRVGG